MTPPPAESVAAMIRPTPVPPDSPTNRDVMEVFMTTPGLGWLLLIGVCLAGLGGGATVWLSQI
jgi:hypothetical protein